MSNQRTNIPPAPLAQFQPHGPRNENYGVDRSGTGWVQGPNVVVPPGGRVGILPGLRGNSGSNVTWALDYPENQTGFISSNTTRPVYVSVSNLNELWFKGSGIAFDGVTLILQVSSVG